MNHLGVAPPIRRLSYFLRRRCSALVSFGAIQAMQILLPLLALPWLARVLKPAAFGLLMYMCLIPPLVALFMDWGLTQAGGREAAWRRGRDQDLSDLLSAALSAKLILILVCALLSLLFWPFLPHAAEYPLAYLLAVLTGMARGLSPVWFFQGAGFGMPIMASFDSGASAAVLILVLIFIHEPANWPLYLFFLAVTKSAAYGWLIWRLCQRYKPILQVGAGFKILKKTAPFFGSAISLTLCYNGAQLVLGYFLTAADMGIIVAVSKMLRALASLANPFTQTLFPELCILRLAAPAQARQILRCSLAITVSMVALAAALAWFAAPVLIELALGSQFESACAVLRISLLAAPLMACNNALANQVLIPFGQEKTQLKIQASCACLGFPLAAIFGCMWGIDGGAFMPVCLESVIFGGFSAAILRDCPQSLLKPRLTAKRLH